jgi:hypothetical protein
MKKQLFMITLLLLTMLLFISNMATASESNSYQISWDLIASNHDGSSSNSYNMEATVGEQVIGFSVGNNYQVESGFWYGKENIPTETTSIYLPVVLR